MSEGPIGRLDLVGQGRVGQALRSRLGACGRLADVVVREAGQLDPSARRPVIVCTRNDDLEGVMAAAPRSRWPDLVFVQNGMLRPWLQDQGLDDATRGLLFFAVPTAGADVQIGTAPSPFHGPHAEAVVDALEHAGLPARKVDGPTFARLEVEKLVWNSAFGLLCEALDTTVGGACEAHPDTTHALCAELIDAACASLRLAVDIPRMIDSQIAYSRSIAGYRGQVKEWVWRNGWFVSMDRVLPTHEALLRRAGIDPATGARAA